MKDYKKIVLKNIYLIAVMIGSVIFCSAISLTIINITIKEESLKELINACVTPLICYPIFFVIISRKYNFKLKDIFIWPEMTAIKNAIVILSGGLILFLISFIIRFLNLSNGTQPQLVQNLDTHIFLYFILLCVIAPVIEEIIFRGLWIYTNNYNLFSIIFSAIFFSVCHLSAAYFLYYFVFSIISTFLFIKNKSIIPSILFHAAINNIMFLIAIVQ